MDHFKQIYGLDFYVRNWHKNSSRRFNSISYNENSEDFEEPQYFVKNKPAESLEEHQQALQKVSNKFQNI